MRRPSAIRIAALLASMCAAVPAAAQDVTQADVAHLQDAVFEAGTDLARLRTGDAALLGELRAQLNALRARVASFGMQLRERQSVSSSDHEEVRAAIEALRRRARGDETATARNVPPAMTPLDVVGPPQGALELPVGMEVEVRLLTLLDSSTVRVGDRLEAVTPADVRVNGQVLLPAGALLRGIVTSVGSARERRTWNPSVRFDYVTVNYRAHPIRATLSERAPVIATANGDLKWLPGAVLQVRFEASSSNR